MEPLIPELPVEATSVDQVALVVPDLQSALDRYGALLGIGPWNVRAFEPPVLTETTYRGEPTEYGLYLATASAGDISVELIEPTIGPNVYEDHLDEHGPGLHHVGCFGWDRDEALQVVDGFVDNGFPIIQEGTVSDSTFWYFDTRDALDGLILEVVARGGESKPPDAIYPKEPYPF